jgi:hypothetical protein
LIDLNSSAALRAQGVEEIAAAIDDAIVLSNARQKPRTYLGASAIGAECERQTQLDYIVANDLPGAPTPGGEGFSAKTLRMFAMGHAFEELAVKWLRDGGFDVRTHGKDGKQFGFESAGGQFSGHCDGVIVAGPEGQEYPLLWEHKALGPKSWKEVAKHGVTKAKPVYAAQVALYQAYMDLQNPALFMATNRDTAEVYLELVPFNAELAQATSDKAARILQATKAGELSPKAFASAEFFACKWCRWREFCWNEGGL